MDAIKNEARKRGYGQLTLSSTPNAGKEEPGAVVEFEKCMQILISLNGFGND